MSNTAMLERDLRRLRSEVADLRQAQATAIRDRQQLGVLQGAM